MLVVPDDLADEELLRRRLKPAQYDLATKKAFPSAFICANGPPDEVSVDRVEYRDLDTSLHGLAGFGCCTLCVSKAQEITGLRPESRPLDNNPAHAVILVPKDSFTNGESPRDSSFFVPLAEAADMESLPNAQEYRAAMKEKDRQRKMLAPRPA